MAHTSGWAGHSQVYADGLGDPGDRPTPIGSHEPSWSGFANDEPPEDRQEELESLESERTGAKSWWKELVSCLDAKRWCKHM